VLLETDCKGVPQIPCPDSDQVVFAKEFCGAPKVGYSSANPGKFPGMLVLPLKGFLLNKLEHVNVVWFAVV
jgi:hypothetical protein